MEQDARTLGVQSEAGGRSAAVRGPGGSAVPAGFWIRAVALSIDLFLLLIVALFVILFYAARIDIETLDVLSALLYPFLWIFVIKTVYFVVFHALVGQTLGKMSCSIIVVREDLSRLGWLTALWRYVMWQVSWLTLTIGFIMAAFNPQKRALHDQACGTLVVFKWSIERR